MKTMLTMTLSFLLAACAQATPGRPGSAPNPAAADASTLEGAPGAPIAARWIVKSEANGRTVLVAHVEAKSALAVPVQVIVRTPADVQIVSGPREFVIPASAQPFVVEQEIVVVTNGHPTDDLVLEAHAAGSTFGFHSRDAYRLGRQQSTPAQPGAEGPNLKVGDRDFGASVPMKP